LGENDEHTKQENLVFAGCSWRGTEREWSTQETALNVFSYGIIPVMFSVHTIVSWDFAMALQPGWHSSIFGPYFVVGALFSGTGAVATPPSGCWRHARFSRLVTRT
jgi:molybdopterin-containing oxidoreductase family membrane subunit